MKRKEQRKEKFQLLTEEEKERCKAEQQAEERRKEQNLLTSYHSSSHICIDLSFYQSNSERELRSLAAQIRLSYGELKKNEAPLALHLSSFYPQHDQDNQPNNDVLYKILISQGIENWKIYLHRESIEELCDFENTDLLNNCDSATSLSKQDDSISQSNRLYKSNQVVFLSPDAEEPLPSVLPDHVYVIGGIVDKNIKKCLTLTKASEYNFQVYRLPIPEYYPNSKGSQTVINNIDGVFNATQNWEEAIRAAVPPRRTGERRILCDFIPL